MTRQKWCIVQLVSQLNDNYSLKAIVMNVYKEHSDTIQGIGVNRNDVVLRYGKNVTGITKTSDITGLYTAIRPLLNDPPKMVHRSTEYNCYKLEGKGNDVTVTCIHKGYAKEYENIIVKNIIK